MIDFFESNASMIRTISSMPSLLWAATTGSNNQMGDCAGRKERLDIEVVSVVVPLWS